jgi:hypothetical protein
VVEFYKDVTVVAHYRLRVSATVEEEPTKDELINMINDEEYDDIIEEERITVVEVLSVE